VKGLHAFRASSQSRGAASNASSSRRGRGKGKGKTNEQKGENPPFQFVLDLDDDGNGGNNGDGQVTHISPSPSSIPTSTIQTNANPNLDDNGNGQVTDISPSPSSIPTSAIHSPSSVSLSATSSNKRKYSAEGDSVMSSSPGGSIKKQKQRPSDALQSTVSNGFRQLDTAIRGLQVSRESRDLLRQQSHYNAARQVGLASSSAEPTRKMQAMDQIQAMDRLTAEQTVALLDLFKDDDKHVETFLTIKRDDVRDAWVSKRLRELSFVVEDTN